MTAIIVSARLRGELEDLVPRTPSAKERCRAQAVLWLAEGLSAEQVAETFQVSRQTSTTGRTASSGEKASTSGTASSTHRARAALLRSPGSSTLGSARPSLKIPANWV